MKDDVIEKAGLEKREVNNCNVDANDPCKGRRCSDLSQLNSSTENASGGQAIAKSFRTGRRQKGSISGLSFSKKMRKSKAKRKW